MQEILVIGAGPAGLLAAWVARQRGARVKVLASGIGTTHVAPGWLGILDTGASLLPGLDGWIAGHPQHPYALAGVGALRGGIAALRAACEPAKLRYVGDLSANYRLPTALGAAVPAALAPESFVAGDLRQPGALLIAGPVGWRDFYPTLCAGNLARQGFAAHGAYFELPEMRALSQFDVTSVGMAHLFEQADVRARVAARLKPVLAGATRVGLPAVLGLERADEVWHDLQDRLGLPVFEIPTLPPSVPGMRLFNAFKAALARAGVPVLLDMTATSAVVEGGRATGLVVPNVVRDQVYRADTFILATGGLYGGGITSDFRGDMREVVFGLPLRMPGAVEAWFDASLLAPGSHPVHAAGVRANAQMQPVDDGGRVVVENVRVAGRLLANYNPVAEGSAEGVWLATAYRAGCDDRA